MLDSRAFEASDFDAKQWINSSLSASTTTSTTNTSTTNAVATAENLIPRLQFLMDELEKRFDVLSKKAVEGTVKAMRETSSISKSSILLSSSLSHFESSLTKVEKSTAHSTLYLEQLDAVKQRMLKCQIALGKAKEFSATQNDVQQVFASNNVQQIADKIQAMRESLNVLKDLPQFQHANSLLSSMQLKLENMAKPLLIKAFQSHDTEICKDCNNVFKQIGREQEFVDLYAKTQQQLFQDIWQSFPQQTENQVNFFQWLPQYYEMMLAAIHKEREWMKNIFTSTSKPFLQLLLQVFISSSKSYQQRLHETFTMLATNNNSEYSPLDQLILARTVAINFSQALFGLLSSNNALQPSDENELEIQILQPFFYFQNSYVKLESRSLTSAVTQIYPQQSRRDLLTGTIGNINKSIPRLFLCLEAAVDRLINFTGGAQAPGLIQLFTDVLSSYFNHLNGLLQLIRIECKLDDASTTTIAAQSEDWTAVQAALKLLESSHVLDSRLAAFDRGLRSKIAERKEKLLGKAFLHQRLSNQECDYSIINCVHLRNEPVKVEDLLSFFAKLKDHNVSFKLLDDTSKQSIAFNSSIQSFVSEAMFNFIRVRLNTLPTLPEWKKEREAGKAASVAAVGSSFSFSPLPYVTLIGNHLLTLPQQLFTSNDDDDDDDDNDDTADDNADDSTASEEADFAHKWISAIAKQTMSLYSQKILEIPQLSPLGCKQLAADIGYLNNILTSFGVDIDPRLEQLNKLLAVEPSEFANVLADDMHMPTTQSLAKKVATMRGVPNLQL